MWRTTSDRYGYDNENRKREAVVRRRILPSWRFHATEFAVIGQAGHRLTCQPFHRLGGGQQFARAVGPPFELDLALGEAARTDHQLPWDADQIGCGEFRSGPVVEVVVEHVEPTGSELAIEL